MAKRLTMEPRVVMSILLFGIIVSLIVGMPVASAITYKEPITMYVSTEKGALNVREWESKDAPVIFTVERGQAVKVEWRGKYWTYIDRYGDKGWVASQYLSMEPPLPLETLSLDVEDD